MEFMWYGVLCGTPEFPVEHSLKTTGLEPQLVCNKPFSIDTITLHFNEILPNPQVIGVICKLEKSGVTVQVLSSSLYRGSVLRSPLSTAFM
ncbi:hypothetical protein TNCV_1952161 [Trichonephila clavipes]|nr:hypothetical protein TNCV_1952161 [Trichonephila clavipes]